MYVLSIFLVSLIELTYSLILKKCSLFGALSPPYY